ncbi:MAG: hypothetical protein K0S53_3403 [Bacteroidetes bacterium]|jgi:hypothetical protein|nr:hypothetical protein [Bacteroidota bacterium]
MKSESSHANNVANFEDLYSFCQGFGGNYNPSTNSIMLNQLNQLQNSALLCMSNVSATKAQYQVAKDNYKIAFLPLKDIVTKAMAALQSSGASKQIISNAKSLENKIKGRYKKLTKADAGKTIEPPEGSEQANTNNNLNAGEASAEPIKKRRHSRAQQDDDNLIANFSNLIQLLSLVPTYAPNEVELSINGLNTFLATMKSTNSLLINAYTSYSNELTARNQTLYMDNTGLVAIAAKVKLYVKSVYGLRSPQYKKVAALKFKKFPL